MIRSTECPLGIDDQRETVLVSFPFRESSSRRQEPPSRVQGCSCRWGSQSALLRLSWMLAQAASVASRYAFGADGVGAARPGACGEADRRLALRARRSALRAQRRLPICVLHTRAPSASSACKGCSWRSARGAQLRRSAGRSARTRASARTPACRSAGTGHRAVQLCVRWCTSSAWRASASAAR